MASWLFIPGSNDRALQKIDELNVTRVIIDLEDAVPPSEKQNARSTVQKVLSKTNRKCLVRINDINSGLWEDDLKSIFHANLEGIVFPKAELPEDIAKLADLINLEEEKHGMEKDTIKIYPLIESAKGVLNAQGIASSHKNVVQLLFGGVDYSLDLNLVHTKHGNELLYARSHLVLCSKFSNLLSPIDTVFIDMEDIEGLKEECIRVKELGFHGKMIIHPKQISTVNAVFRIDPLDIKQAEEIIEVFTQSNYKAVKHNGLMIDKPVYLQALKIIENVMT